MPEIILSINAGSSSVKISVYKTPEDGASVPKQLAEATVEGLTAPPAKLKYERGDEKIKGKELENVTSQEDGFRYILDHLTNDEGLPELNHKEDIRFTCHRVVHGGDYPRSQVIDKETYHHIEELSDLRTTASIAHPLRPTAAIVEFSSRRHAVPRPHHRVPTSMLNPNPPHHPPHPHPTHPHANMLLRTTHPLHLPRASLTTIELWNPGPRLRLQWPEHGWTDTNARHEGAEFGQEAV